MIEELLTTEDLSNLLGVSKSTIKRWTDEGRLHCFRTPGGHRKFKHSNVRDFVDQYHYDKDVTKTLIVFNSESQRHVNETLDVTQRRVI